MPSRLKVATTKELGKMLKLTPTSVSANYREAQLGALGTDPSIFYSLPKVARMITKTSRCKVSVDDLDDLIKRKEAVRLLQESGKRKGLGSLDYWRSRHVGPRVIVVGKHQSRYVRSEFMAWLQAIGPTHSRTGNGANAPL